MLKIFALVAALAAVVLPQAAHAQLPPPTPHSVSGSSQVAGTILTSSDAAFHIHSSRVSTVCPWVDMPHQYTVAAAATAAGSRPDHRP